MILFTIPILSWTTNKSEFHTTTVLSTIQSCLSSISTAFNTAWGFQRALRALLHILILYCIIYSYSSCGGEGFPWGNLFMTICQHLNNWILLSENYRKWQIYETLGSACILLCCMWIHIHILNTCILYTVVSKLTLTHDEGLIPPGHETGRCLVQTFTFFVLNVGLPTSCRLLWSEFFLSHTSCHHTPSDWNPLLHSKSFLPLFQFVHMKLICYISALSAIMVRTFILQICII